MVIKGIKLLLITISVFLSSSCVSKGELYNVSILEDMIHVVSSEMPEDEFCETFTDSYLVARDATDFISCEGTNGHYQYLLDLNFEYGHNDDIVVKVDLDNDIHTYYIMRDNAKIVIGRTPNSAVNGDYFLNLN